MKKYLPLAALLLLSLASVSFAQPTPVASPPPAPKPKPAMTKAQILRKLSAAETKLWEAWKNKDVKPFKTNLTADSLMIGDTGVSGKNDIVQMIASMPCEVKSFQLSDWKLTMLNSSTALITYKGSTEGTCAGAPIPTVWASSVWVNRGGRWLSAHHQETPIAAR